MKEERCENGHLIFSDEPGCPVCMPTQPDNEWQERLKALHPKYFIPEDIKIDEVTFAHDLKGTIEMIEEVIFLQKASLKQRDTKWKDAHAKYVADTLDGIKPEEAYRELLSALNEID